MSKLTRDARAFARRVQMGTSRLWLIVEGRVHDRSFYDRLLESHALTQSGGYSVRLGEQIEVDGVVAGGKQHLHALYELFESESLLRQSNSRGVNRIAVAMDRDLEGFLNEPPASPHVITTTLLDVEAEILLNGDLRRSISAAYSVSREELPDDLTDGRVLAAALAALWRDWITAGFCSASCGVETGVRHARISRINAGGFGPVDPATRDELFDRIEQGLTTQDERRQYELAQAEIARRFEVGEEWMLMKGKWLASYVSHLVRDLLRDVPSESNVSADVVSKTCLETLDFRGEWAEHYHGKLDLLHAS